MYPSQYQEIQGRRSIENHALRRLLYEDSATTTRTTTKSLPPPNSTSPSSLSSSSSPKSIKRSLEFSFPTKSHNSYAASLPQQQPFNHQSHFSSIHTCDQNLNEFMELTHEKEVIKRNRNKHKENKSDFNNGTESEYNEKQTLLFLEAYQNWGKKEVRPPPMSPPISCMSNFEHEFDKWNMDSAVPIDNVFEVIGNDEQDMEKNGNDDVMKVANMNHNCSNNSDSLDAEVESVFESLKELTLMDKFKGLIKKKSPLMTNKKDEESGTITLLVDNKVCAFDEGGLFQEGTKLPQELRVGLHGVQFEKNETKQECMQHQHSLMQPNTEKQQSESTQPLKLKPAPPIPPLINLPPPPLLPPPPPPLPCYSSCSSACSSLTTLPNELVLLPQEQRSTLYNHEEWKSSHAVKSILKCKVNRNFDIEVEEILKQDEVQFDEFWHNFEINELAKCNFANEQLLTLMRMEQVQKYYHECRGDEYYDKE